MKMINDWLTDRLQQSLSNYQFTCLSFIVKVTILPFLKTLTYLSNIFLRLCRKCTPTLNCKESTRNDWISRLIRRFRGECKWKRRRVHWQRRVMEATEVWVTIHLSLRFYLFLPSNPSSLLISSLFRVSPLALVMQQQQSPICLLWSRERELEYSHSSNNLLLAVTFPCCFVFSVHARLSPLSSPGLSPPLIRFMTTTNAFVSFSSTGSRPSPF